MWRCATRCNMMNHLNRPKRNCSTHVFNVAACLRLLKRRFSLSFEAAHERIRQKRPICNPNTGGCSRVSPAGLSNSFESHLPVLDFGAYWLIARGTRGILYMLWLRATIATIVEANGSNSVALNLQVKVFEWNPVKWQASRASCCSWQKNCRVARQGICLLQDMSPFFSLQISFLQCPECILVRWC